MDRINLQSWAFLYPENDVVLQKKKFSSEKKNALDVEFGKKYRVNEVAKLGTVDKLFEGYKTTRTEWERNIRSFKDKKTSDWGTDKLAYFDSAVTINKKIRDDKRRLTESKYQFNEFVNVSLKSEITNGFLFGGGEMYLNYLLFSFFYKDENRNYYFVPKEIVLATMRINASFLDLDLNFGIDLQIVGAEATFEIKDNEDKLNYHEEIMLDSKVIFGVKPSINSVEIDLSRTFFIMRKNGNHYFIFNPINQLNHLIVRCDETCFFLHQTKLFLSIELVIKNSMDIQPLGVISYNENGQNKFKLDPSFSWEIGHARPTKQIFVKMKPQSMVNRVLHILNTFEGFVQINLKIEYVYIFKTKETVSNVDTSIYKQAFVLENIWGLRKASRMLSKSTELMEFEDIFWQNYNQLKLIINLKKEIIRLANEIKASCYIGTFRLAHLHKILRILGKILSLCEIFKNFEWNTFTNMFNNLQNYKILQQNALSDFSILQDIIRLVDQYETLYNAIYGFYNQLRAEQYVNWLPTQETMDLITQIVKISEKLIPFEQNLVPTAFVNMQLNDYKGRIELARGEQMRDISIQQLNNDQQELINNFKYYEALAETTSKELENKFNALSGLIQEATKKIGTYSNLKENENAPLELRTKVDSVISEAQQMIAIFAKKKDNYEKLYIETNLLHAGMISVDYLNPESVTDFFDKYKSNIITWETKCKEELSNWEVFTEAQIRNDQKFAMLSNLIKKPSEISNQKWGLGKKRFKVKTEPSTVVSELNEMTKLDQIPEKKPEGIQTRKTYKKYNQNIIGADKK